MEEIWKDIHGYEGLYQVSNLGRVKSLPRGKQWPYRQTHNNIRKPKLNKNGYLCVNLSKENNVQWFNVHRLVAMTFLPNPDNLPFVNHKDETRTNNCIENLEWCTHEYNCAYGTARERQRKSRAANPKDKAVRRIVGDKLSIAVNMLSPNGAFIKSFKSITEASDSMGIDKGAIIAWCKGKRTKSRKYRFEYGV